MLQKTPTKSLKSADFQIRVSQHTEEEKNDSDKFNTSNYRVTDDQPIAEVPSQNVCMEKLTKIFLSLQPNTNGDISNNSEILSVSIDLTSPNQPPNFVADNSPSKHTAINNTYISNCRNDSLTSEASPALNMNSTRKRGSIQMPSNFGRTAQEANPQAANLGISQKKQNHRKSSSQSPSHDKNTLKHIVKSQKRKTFYDVIANFYVAKKFMSVLKNLSTKRTPKYLTDHQFNLIGDQAFFQDVYKKEFDGKEEKRRFYGHFKTMKKIESEHSYLKRFQTNFVEFFNQIKVFDPSKASFLVWDSLIMLCIMVIFIVIPLEWSFGFEIIESWKGVVYFRVVATYFLTFNMFIKFNTSYYKKGIIVQKRASIAQYYIYDAFWKDLIGVSPLILKEIWGIDNWYVSFAQAAFFFQKYNFDSIFKKFEELIFFDKTMNNKLALFKLIIRILLLSHFFACFWHLIGYRTSQYENSWLIDKNLLTSQWYIRYLYSYYYVCVTMNTVGYGDINPKNSTEIIFNIILIYISCALFAYSINSIGLVVADIMKQENEFKNDLNTINDFMREKKIGFDLIMRVRKYLEYIWHEEKIDKVENQVKIVEKLSDSLKEELLLEANGTIIRDVKMLSLNFSEDTLRRAVSVMKEVRFTPGDIVFMKGDSENKDLYIIRKGEIEIFIESSKSSCPVTVLKKLKEGDVFGELAFFSGQGRSASARSTDFTAVFVIKQEEFLDIVRKYGKDFEKYNEIKDNINIYNDYSDIFFKCFSCNENNHHVSSCTLVHNYIINEIIINRHIYTQPQERKEECKRKKKKAGNAKMQLSKIELASFKIQTELFPSHESEEDESNASEKENNLAIEEENSSFSSDTNREKEKKDSDQNNESLDETLDEAKKDNFKQLDRRQSRKNKILYRKSFSKMGTKNFFSKTKTGELEVENIEGQKKVGDQLKNFLINNSSLLSEMNLLAHNMNPSLNGTPNKVSFDFSNLENNNKSMAPNNGGINRQATSSEKIVNALKGWMENSKFSSAFKGKSMVGNPAYIDDILLEMDKIKSFDFYFSYNNIENILEKMEFLKKKNPRKTKKRTTSHLKLNKEKTTNAVEGFRRGSFMINKEDVLSLEENLAKPDLWKQPKNTVMRKNFFKNVPHLEKLLQEELFDPNKIKAYYKNKYLKEEKKGIVKFIKVCVLGLFKFICFSCFKRGNKTLKKLSYLNERK